MEAAFTSRGWDLRTIDDVQVTTVASVFGVGHATLIDQMSYSLRYLPLSVAAALKKRALPLIKERIIGFRTTANLSIVDSHWPSIPIDLQLGDLVLFHTNGSRERPDFADSEIIRCLPQANVVGTLWEAWAPGVASVLLPNGVSTVLRVMKPGFVGRAKYRFLREDSNVDTA